LFQKKENKSQQSTMQKFEPVSEGVCFSTPLFIYFLLPVLKLSNLRK